MEFIRKYIEEEYQTNMLVFNYIEKQLKFNFDTVYLHEYNRIYDFRHAETARQIQEQIIDKWYELGIVNYPTEECDIEPLYPPTNFKELKIEIPKTKPEPLTKLDKEISEILGVPLSDYFWRWIEYRIGNKVSLQFNSHKINFVDRKRQW